MRWLNGFTYLVDMNLGNFWEIVEDGGAWCAWSQKELDSSERLNEHQGHCQWNASLLGEITEQTPVSHWKLTAVELHTVQPQQSWWGDVGRMGKSPEIRVRKPGLGVSLSNYLTLGKSPKFKESTWNCSFILSGMLVRIKGIEYLRTFWCLFINVRQNWVWEMCSWMEGWQWKQGVPGRRERKE